MRNWRICDKEIEYVNQVLNSGFPGRSDVNFTGKLEALFAEKTGTKYAITFCNGTATLHTGLVALGVGPGDEVIVPPLTMGSTSFAVLHAGATPVYADIDPETFEIDPASVAERITPRTKAILPVALYGLLPDMKAIMELAKKHSLGVLEDDAECFFGTAYGRKAGQWGDIASFSFQNTKHITCGEGGITVTDNPEYAEKMRRFSSLGYAAVSAEPGKSKIEKSQLVSPSYCRHSDMGFNYRLAEICAAVAFAQLERLEEFVAKRQYCAESFRQVMNQSKLLVPQRIPEGFVSSYWALPARIADPEVDWNEFYRKFNEFGGDGFYGPWRLTYTEPYFSRIIPEEHRNCPKAEAVQPRMIQMKTQYGTEEEVKVQCEALARTIAYFS